MNIDVEGLSRRDVILLPAEREVVIFGEYGEEIRASIP